MKLESMTDFVLSQKKSKNLESSMRSVYDYAEFVSKKPTLGMFVPCDEFDNVLKRPKESEQDVWLWDKYFKAESRVIFDGWDIDINSNDLVRIFKLTNRIIFKQDKIYYNSNHIIKTIEDLSKFNLQLK